MWHASLAAQRRVWWIAVGQKQTCPRSELDHWKIELRQYVTIIGASVYREDAKSYLFSMTVRFVEVMMEGFGRDGCWSGARVEVQESN